MAVLLTYELKGNTTLNQRQKFASVLFSIGYLKHLGNNTHTFTLPCETFVCETEDVQKVMYDLRIVEKKTNIIVEKALASRVDQDYMEIYNADGGVEDKLVKFKRTA